MVVVNSPLIRLAISWGFYVEFGRGVGTLRNSHDIGPTRGQPKLDAQFQGKPLRITIVVPLKMGSFNDPGKLTPQNVQCFFLVK